MLEFLISPTQVQQFECTSSESLLLHCIFKCPLEQTLRIVKAITRKKKNHVSNCIMVIIVQLGKYANNH